MILPTAPAALSGRTMVTLAALVALGVSCSPSHEAERELEEVGPDPQVEVVPRAPYLETFSCLELCHRKLEPNPTKRPMREFHTLRTIRHGPAIGWCDFCHDLQNIDQLRLIDGTNISFDESHRLCGQCHGERARDWEAGIHGLQTGSWGGVQLRRGCPYCHDPHVPGVPRVQAMPAPERPVEHGEMP